MEISLKTQPNLQLNSKFMVKKTCFLHPNMVQSMWFGHAIVMILVNLFQTNG